jgi:hypothetical protein
MPTPTRGMLLAMCRAADLGAPMQLALVRGAIPERAPA